MSYKHLSRKRLPQLWVLLVLMAFGLIGCSTPQQVPVKSAAPVKLALVLSGGGGRGFAHIGVIKVLESHGITPDIVVGSSAGAFVGSLYASGMSGLQLQEAAMRLEEAPFFDWRLNERGPLTGKALQDYVNLQIGKRTTENLKRTLGVVATDLGSGESVVFRRGDTGLAVRASCAIPGVFAPVRIGNKDFVDGGVSAPVPVKAAKDMGADYIIAVDIGQKPKWTGKVESLIGVLMQSANIMGHVLSREELRAANFVIAPDLSDVDPASFSDRYKAILRGEAAAIKALDALKADLERVRKG